MTASRGFAALGLLIVLVIVAAVGGGAWYAAKQDPVPVQPSESLATTTIQVPGQTAPNSTTVRKISWQIEKTNPVITEGHEYRRDEQAISVDVTFSDDTTKHYDVSTAYGCTGTSAIEAAADGKKVFGRVNCYYALSGVNFVAYSQNGLFIVERNDESAKDGSIKTTVVLNIRESDKTQATVTFNVYFGQASDNANSVDCAHAVARTVPHTAAVARAALDSLIQGPTAAEKSGGYLGCVSPDVKIKSLTVENSTATVDLWSYGQCGGANTCAAQARSAITHTLKQFPSITNVQIKVNGVPETAGNLDA